MLELLSPECIRLINSEQGLGLNESPTLFMEYHGPSQNTLIEIMDLAKEFCEIEGCNDFRKGLEREERDRLMKARHELAEMIQRNHPNTLHVVMDAAVPISAYPEIIAFAREEREKTCIPGYIFSHAGDGNLHLVFQVDKNDVKGQALIEDVHKRLVSKAISAGGTATGEHGVGIGKRIFMEEEHGKSVQWMKKVKDLFDPNGILNPGKIFL